VRTLSIRVTARLLALPGLLAACGAGDAVDRWSGTIETLENGAVRVTNPKDGLWSSGDAWQLMEDLVLGRTEGDGADVFASISAIEVDPSGNIYVLDRQANELRIFDASGRHVRSVGRSGEGPGEYSAANGLAWLTDDTLVVVDQRGNRYSLLSLDGEYVRSVPRRLGFYGWVFSGGIDGDHIFEVSTAGSEDAPRPVLLGTRLRGGEEALADAIESAAPATESAPRFTADTMPLPMSDAPLYEAFSVRTATAGMVMSVPFTGNPDYHLDGAGGLWHGHGSLPRLYHSAMQGDTLTEIVFGHDPFPVAPEEIAEWETQPSLERFRSLGGQLDMSRIPAVKPYFDGIATDARGNIWLTVPAAPSTPTFAVFDPDGRYLGQLQVSGMTREQYVSHVVRNDRLYFVGRDELDVQRVYVYRIDRAPARADVTGS